MIKKLISTILGLACMFSILAQKDNPDCADKDYDLFTNLEGFFIERCEAAEFKTMEFWIERGSRKVTKDGKYTKLWYKQSPQSTRSIVGKQIVANYANAVKKAKGEVVKDSDDMAYHVIKDGKSLWIAISVGPYAPERKDYYMEIVEEAGMKQEITANIEEALAENGRIALYGIYFDVNKAVVKAESEPAIKEIADYLNKNPRANIFIVGHTDNTGDYAKNIKLSKDRATAIKTYLTTKYKIATTRLFADGVGPLAPVSTNANEEGRKMNRRVEVVLK